MDDSEVKTGFLVLIKRLWPHFLIYNSYAFTVSTLFINIVIIAGIMWPLDMPNSFAVHASELGLLTGTSIYIIAFSGILFGYLADKFSRIKLMACVELIYGIGLFFNGLVPEGQGQTTYILFLVFSLIRGFSIGGIWPLITSHVNDSTEDKERSQFFGAIQGLFQLFQIIGMVISAIVFQNNYWQEYFFIVGVIAGFFGIIILIRGYEPKRGAARKELKGVLASEEIVYDYKLTKETIRSTILAPTNLIAFFEGIFTTILLAVPDFLLVAYLTSPPYNMSPLAAALFMIIFGLPGGLIGSLAFAKVSDRLGKKNIKYRIYIIVFSIVILFSGFIFFFTLPIPNMTAEQGNNLIFLFSLPIFWIMGLIGFIVRSVLGLWNINQPPILQEINLPEAQGKISSANQFLEAIGSGTGPIIAGIVLVVFNQNFQITVLITMVLGIIGGFLWLLATIWVNKDVERISNILELRKEELNNKNNLRSI
ncbi:MAG: MFS transporter [Candidatus Lokiarchaeota archaeon]|nr:MFS transporter [Candidatus Lokiarchaeota archaeon]